MDHVSMSSEAPLGIPMTDEESILGHLEIFCTHVRNMMDIVHTLGQFSKLTTDVRNLPRVSLEVVMNGPPDKDEQQQGDDMYLTVNQPYVNPSGSVTSESDRSKISDGMYYTHVIIIIIAIIAILRSALLCLRGTRCKSRAASVSDIDITSESVQARI